MKYWCFNSIINFAGKSRMYTDIQRYTVCKDWQQLVGSPVPHAALLCFPGTTSLSQLGALFCCMYFWVCYLQPLRAFSCSTSMQATISKMPQGLIFSMSKMQQEGFSMDLAALLLIILAVQLAGSRSGQGDHGAEEPTQTMEQSLQVCDHEVS